MDSNSSSTRLVIGLAAVGLGVVIAGVQLYRRRRAEGAGGPAEEEIEVEGGRGEEEQSVAEDLADDGEAHTSMGANVPQEDGSLIAFFALVFALAAPFWLVGDRKLPTAINLPASALATFVPVTAAAILSYRKDGFNGVKQLLKKAFDYRKIKSKTWLLPALLLAPAIYFSSYVIMRLTGAPLPDPVSIPLSMLPAYFLMFFIGDAGEELGWSGYAIDPMQNRWGALKASILLGVVWAVWHAIPFVQTGNPTSWVVWQSFKTVVMRIVIVWIYNNAGRSVLAAILYHTSDNISWSLFPNNGSGYDPLVTGMVTCLTAVIAIFGWGGRTLRRYRYARVGRA